MPTDPQRIWDDYYQRIRRRRIREAQIVHSGMTAAGVTDSTILAFDFRHFASDDDCIRNLGTQLSENYVTTIKRNERDDNYWLLDGTTRPDGIDKINEECLVNWISFMCDVAQSHGCVFSGWQLTELSISRTWSNEEIDVDPE